MPNRILKQSICSSENVDALSVEAETFFYRLIVQCDDYGRMDARSSILRAACFPLRLDRVTDKSICTWVKELEDACLIETYSVKGHPYLHFVTWDNHQQIRAKRSKYPDPQAADNDLQADDSNGNHLQANVPVIQSNPIQSESNVPVAKTATELPEDDPNEPDPVKHLAIVFEEASGITLSDIPRKARGARYWDALRQMVKMANGTAPELLRNTVLKMRGEGLDLSAPASCLKTFTSLHGKNKTTPPQLGTVYQ